MATNLCGRDPMYPYTSNVLKFREKDVAVAAQVRESWWWYTW